jgi:arylsulfatase A-like enzyme
MLRWNASHLTWVDWQKVIAAYWGFCTYIDDQVQRILDCLKETEQWENTVIVFSSDHGDMLVAIDCLTRVFTCTKKRTVFH